MKKRTKIVLLCAAIVLLAVTAKIEYSKSRANVIKVLVSTPQLHSVDIGDYVNKQAGWDAMMSEFRSAKDSTSKNKSVRYCVAHSREK
jgi:hypothetical protein